MKPALLVLCCAIAAAWLLPRPLGRLSGAGASPRLGIAAWLTAITSVLALALAALGLLARTAIDGWPAFARTVCESVTTGACPPAVYRSAAYELGLAITAFLGGITMVALGWRYGRSLRRASVRTRAHAEAARITGQRIGAGNPAFVLDATQPAVYCVPGRRPPSCSPPARSPSSGRTSSRPCWRTNARTWPEGTTCCWRSPAHWPPSPRPFRCLRAEPVRWRGSPRCAPTTSPPAAPAAIRAGVPC